MNRKQVIETLKMENDLICFDPLKGEEIPLECVNDLNRNCYDAHQEAIRLINKSIPIEWIYSYITPFQVYHDSLSEEQKEKDGAGWVIDVLETMLDEWEKENAYTD